MSEILNAWYVYLLQSSNGKFYTGITTDPQRRLSEHLSGRRGAKFFRSSKPRKLTVIDRCANRSEAQKREYTIRKLSHLEKQDLVQQSISLDF